jgi:hypothetical protein
MEGAQKTKLPKNQWPIKKWATELTALFQRKKSKWLKTHENVSEDVGKKEPSYTADGNVC